LKALHVIPSVGPLRGGPSFAMRHIAQALTEAGVEVDVAATDCNGPERLRKPLGEGLMEGGSRWWYFPRQLRFYTMSAPLWSWLAENVQRYDIVHIHAVFSFATIAAARAARKAGVPYVIRPLGVLNRYGMEKRRPWLKQLSYRFVEKDILEGAAAIQYTSVAEQEEAESLGFRAPAAIIPNPVPLPELTEERATEDYAGRRVLLFLSRIDPKKGIDLLLPAYAALRQKYPEALLVIAGQGTPEYMEELQRLAAQAGVAEEVRWAGFVNGAPKQQLLRAAEFFVLPSYSENFGVAVVEAMLAGLPVLITDQVGIHGEVSAAGAGLVARCDVVQLTQKMDELLRDGRMRQTMGQRGREYALSAYTPAAVGARIRGLYEKILRERGRRA
jgi:glycosyltransferase involved in cell wall biosynthesis